MIALGLLEDHSGKAADTGSAVHAAVHAWHLTSHNGPAAVDAMRALAPAKFPLADCDEAARLLAFYAEDERNQEATVVLLEQSVQVTLPPTDDDPTGQPIVISGTLDQVREERGVLSLWDIKTGSMHRGLEMVHEHALQLAVYQLGAARVLGRPVARAGVIRIRDYPARIPQPVFWAAPWTLDQLPLLLDAVREQVARIRRGIVAAGPGSHCSWCPAGGLNSCLSIMKEKLA